MGFPTDFGIIQNLGFLFNLHDRADVRNMMVRWNGDIPGGHPLVAIPQPNFNAALRIDLCHNGCRERPRLRLPLHRLQFHGDLKCLPPVSCFGRTLQLPAVAAGKTGSIEAGLFSFDDACHNKSENKSENKKFKNNRSKSCNHLQFNALNSVNRDEGSIPFTRSIDNQQLTKQCSKVRRLCEIIRIGIRIFNHGRLAALMDRQCGKTGLGSWLMRSR